MFKFFRRKRPPAASPPAEVPPPPTQASDASGLLIVESADVQRSQRIPPGQSRAKKWPVLHYADVPALDRTSWRLRVFGAVLTPLELTWDDLMSLPRVRVHADMHCVTSWSVLDQLWEGVSVSTVLARAGIDSAARFLMAHGADTLSGREQYSTNMPLDFAIGADALLATHCNGQPLSPQHGGPVRLVVPRLYAWKSAKWLTGLEVMVADRPGFWERNGYHPQADPWTEERYHQG